MKNLKSKLLASAAMLMLSVIMVTSASFAWFTISAAPEISNIQTSVATNGNLEIALDNGEQKAPAASAIGDAGKNETWGNLVDLNGYFSSANFVLRPVDVAEVADGNIAAGTVRIPDWGLDGRLKELKASTATNVATEHLKGIVTYTDGAKQNPTAYAVRVDFWLRTNVAGSVTLTTAKDRGAGQDGLGSTLTGEGWNEAVKVAFQPGGTGELIVAERDEAGALTVESGIVSFSETEVAAETPKLVSMYLYMDGADMTNADFENTAKNISLNVQFAHSATLTPMDVQASEHGRVTAE